MVAFFKSSSSERHDNITNLRNGGQNNISEYQPGLRRYGLGLGLGLGLEG